ncbi:chromate efflux transporter [Candidatus Woesearchaeota archaeon]|nr:chromate efflux transporter [Candidatus Woesearchaeota archaeon]
MQKSIAKAINSSKLKNANLSDLYLYFLKLGTFCFGGPIALAASMERDLVEKKKVVSLQEYKDGLALAQLAPGPMATQLAMYIGYIRGGLIGSTIVSLALILPSFLIVLLLSWFYVKFNGLFWLQAMFYGISAAVIAVIAKGSYKLLKNTIHTHLLWAIAIVLAIVTAITREENFWAFLAAGILTMLVYAYRHTEIFAVNGIGNKKERNGTKIGKESIEKNRNSVKKSKYNIKKTEKNKNKKTNKSLLAFFLPASLYAAGSSSLLLTLFLYFAKVSLFVFGSGLAIVPFLYGGVVTNYHWLDERQFLDAVAVAMITPGPIVITVAFIGYLVAGLKGAALAALGMFLPVYIVTIALTPIFAKISRNVYVRGFVDGITAAAFGALAGAVVVLATKSLVDVTTLIISLATLLLVFKTKIPEPVIILGAGLIGIIISLI